jgi:hypothetical protein
MQRHLHWNFPVTTNLSFMDTCIFWLDPRSSDQDCKACAVQLRLGKGTMDAAQKLVHIINHVFLALIGG